jgi:hypothetical protein
MPWENNWYIIMAKKTVDITYGHLNIMKRGSKDIRLFNQMRFIQIQAIMIEVPLCHTPFPMISIPPEKALVY